MKKTITICVLALLIVPVLTVTATENGNMETERISISGVLFTPSRTFEAENEDEIPARVNTGESPNTPVITGNTVVNECEINSYFIKAIDPQGDDVFFKISWGDGTVIYWDGPHKSGKEVQYTHAWCPYCNPGATDFTIQVLVKDVNDNMGNCGVLKVTVGNNVHQSSIGSSFLQLVEKVLERFPILENLLNRLMNLKDISDGNIFNAGIESTGTGLTKGGEAEAVEMPSPAEEMDIPFKPLPP